MREIEVWRARPQRTGFDDSHCLMCAYLAQSGMFLSNPAYALLPLNLWARAWAAP